MSKTLTAPQAEALAIIPAEGSVSATLTVDVHAEKWPDLSKAVARPLNLDVEYWNPEAEGESKVLVFIEIKREDTIPDFNDPEKTVQKDCAYFVEQPDIFSRTG